MGCSLFLFKKVTITFLYMCCSLICLLNTSAAFALHTYGLVGLEIHFLQEEMSIWSLIKLRRLTPILQSWMLCRDTPASPTNCLHFWMKDAHHVLTAQQYKVFSDQKKEKVNSARNYNSLGSNLFFILRLKTTTSAPSLIELVLKPFPSEKGWKRRCNYLYKKRCENK